MILGQQIIHFMTCGYESLHVVEGGFGCAFVRARVR